MQTKTLIRFFFSNATKRIIDAEGVAEPSRVQSKPEEEEANKLSSKKIKYQIILLTVGRKLVKNPNTYACLAGLIWSLVSFRYQQRNYVHPK